MAPARPCARVGFKISLDIECEDVSLLVFFINLWERLFRLDSYEIAVVIQFGLTKLTKFFYTYFNV